MNRWLENRVKQLEDELLEAKDDLENLEKQLNSANSNKLNSCKQLIVKTVASQLIAKIVLFCKAK